MSYQNNKNKNRLSLRDLIINISIIFEADSPELISEIAYYLYSDTLEPTDKDNTKKFVRMNQNGFQRFLK